MKSADIVNPIEVEAGDGNPFHPAAATVNPVPRVGPTSSATRLRSMLAYGVGAVFWGIALFGVLQLHRFEGLFNTHALCGPWGCLPPIEALISYHGFWLVLLTPPAVMLFTHLPLPIARIASQVACWGGLALSVGAFTWAVVDWVATTRPELHQYALQHGLKQVFSLVDTPMLQTTLIGVAGLLICRRRNRRDRTSLTDISAKTQTSVLARV